MGKVSPKVPPKVPKTDGLDAAVEDLKKNKEAAGVKAPPARPASVQINNTVPLDKSLEALKARRKPKTNKKDGQKNVKTESASDGPRRTDTPDAGLKRGGWGGIVLPIDFFAGRDPGKK